MTVIGSYTEIYDTQTEVGTIGALKFTTPTDGAPAAHLGGLFAQFRKFKYLGCKVAMIPAQRLPADPLQVSYDAGEPTIDPRDILNPILHKHYAGERTALDLFLDGYFTQMMKGNKGVNADLYPQQEAPAGSSIAKTRIPAKDTTANRRNAQVFYGNQLMDPSWRADHVQAGVFFRGRPMVWDVQSTRPLTYNLPITASNVDLGQPAGVQTTGLGEIGLQGAMVGPDNVQQSQVGKSNVTTGKIAGYQDPATGYTGAFVDDWYFIGSNVMRLGWLPTNPTTMGKSASAGIAIKLSEVTRLRMPKIYMHLMLLPPAYKQPFYYRLLIKHSFAFRDMTSLKAIDAIDAQAAYQLNPEPFTPPTPALRMETFARLTESLASKPSESSIEAIGMELTHIADSIGFAPIGAEDPWTDEESDYLDKLASLLRDKMAKGNAVKTENPEKETKEGA